MSTHETRPCPQEHLPVPRGPFVMGLSNEQRDHLVRASAEARVWRQRGWFDREQPSHIVSLAAYSIAKHPVTVGAYRQFIESGGYRMEEYWTDAGWAWKCQESRRAPAHWDESPWTDTEDLPVIGVSWFEALAFCAWLREEAGRHVRLPSEAEWEKAARGPGALLYPWGNTFKTAYCNTRAHGVERTIPVHTVPEAGDSPYGVSGMIGNVSEWTASRFAPYPYRASDGREELQGDALRVTRGASWYSPALRARATARGMNDPWFCDHDVGFRIASSNVQEPTPPASLQKTSRL